MRGAEQLKEILPRPILRRLRRVLGWVYWSRALSAPLLRGEQSGLPEGALDCVVARNEYGLYCVPRSCRDKHEAQRILQARVWEPETIELMAAERQSGDIVHAGTFFGDFLPALSRSRRDGALVWGFEPNSESFRCAQVTTLLNGLENVVLTHAALDAKGGERALLATTFRTGVRSGGGSHVLRDLSLLDGQETEEVDLVSIDEIVGPEREVAVIQLDVEGHEQQALTGALGTIARCRPLILLERVPTPDWFGAHLAPLGYRRDGLVAVNTILRAR